MYFVTSLLYTAIILTKYMITGDAGTRLLLDLESGRRNVFHTSDAMEILGASRAAVNGLLHRLAKKGRIYRIERGKYAVVPAAAGSAGVWTELPEVIGWRLAEPAYIGFGSALFYWDMTEQYPCITQVATTRRKRRMKYEYYEFNFVTLDSKRFFGQKTVTLEDQPVVISDREKTLVDCAMHPRYCGTLEEVAKGLFGVWDELDVAKMFEYAERIGVRAVRSRLLYLLDVLGLDPPESAAAEGREGGGKRDGYAWLDPTWHKKALGYSKKHRLIINRDNESLMRWYGH